MYLTDIVRQFINRKMKKGYRMLINWKLESDVNDYVKKQFENLGLKKLQDYNEESAMSD
jgi:restriction enzyme bgcI alpha subunit